MLRQPADEHRRWSTALATEIPPEPRLGTAGAERPQAASCERTPGPVSHWLSWPPASGSKYASSHSWMLISLNTENTQSLRCPIRQLVCVVAVHTCRLPAQQLSSSGWCALRLGRSVGPQWPLRLGRPLSESVNQRALRSRPLTVHLWPCVHHTVGSEFVQNTQPSVNTRLLVVVSCCNSYVTTLKTVVHDAQGAVAPSL